MVKHLTAPWLSYLELILIQAVSMLRNRWRPYRAFRPKEYAPVDDTPDWCLSYWRGAAFAMACGMTGCLRLVLYLFDDVSSRAIQGGYYSPRVRLYR